MALDLGLFKRGRSVGQFTGREVHPGVTRPDGQFALVPVGDRPAPLSNRFNWALVSCVGWLLPQRLPRGGDMADKGARTRPCASAGVTGLVSGAAWRCVPRQAVRGASNARPRAVSGSPPALARPQHPAPSAPTPTRDGALLGRASVAPRGAPWGGLSAAVARCRFARASCHALFRPPASAYGHAVR